jgi:hypothetical protein
MGITREILDTDFASDFPASFTTKEIARLRLVDTLKAMIEASNPLTDRWDLWSDLLQSAIDDVNWQEIAENWIERLSEVEA